MPSIESNWDMSFFDQLSERMYRMEDIEIEGGYFEDSKIHSGSGLPIGTLALIQERGSIKRNIPSRAFVLYSAVYLAEESKAMSKAYTDYALKRKSAKVSMTPVGRLMVRSIQKSIMSQKFVPLAPTTISHKGSSTILVENHELINGATYKINGG